MTHDFQILCAGECVDRCDAAYIVGLEARGLSANARRQIEAGHMRLCEWTNAALLWRLRAAAMGVSFLPARTMLGTETFARSAARTVDCPFTGRTYAALPALSPDVALIHVHEADPTGSAIIRGLTVADEEIAQASKHVLITAEKIVPVERMREQSDRVNIPGTLVDAVVEVPYGSYPGNMAGLYYSDEQHLRQWLEAEKDPGTFAEFVDRHIRDTRDFQEYLDLCGGTERMEALRRQELML
jgi:glutaconate CoA-transferase subunit A